MTDEIIESMEFFEEYNRLEDIAPHLRGELKIWKRHHVENFIEEVTHIAINNGFKQQLINKLQEND